MNREGAETYLRVLAEAIMRGSLAPAAAPPPWDTGASRMAIAGHALTTVGALDLVTLEEILTDIHLAMSIRQLRGHAGQAATTARWFTQSRSIRSVRLAAGPALAGPEPPEEEPDDGKADRFVPAGLATPFRAGASRGDLYLMSFAHTGSGARFVAAWGSVHHVGVIPVDELTVTDDRGARYTLEGIPSGDPGWAAEIWLRPTPPKDIRWLDVAPPYRQPARIDLRAASPGIPDGEPRVSAAELSPGEHLLIRLAEHLLTSAPNPRGRWRATAPGGPLRPLTTGLGDIVGALEAADVLSPLSPVPARLATLCASMDIDGHGIAAAPAYDLPEPWVSVLAHYRRRKPEPVPLGEGYAALAASLPALDGIRLALLGLHHTEGSSYLHVLARGRMPDPRPGPLAADLTFPLSVWLRDSGGRWHACCPSLQHRADCECLIRMQLVPPLTRPTDRLEVLAGGQAAEVRTILPLGWRYPS